MLEGWRCFHCDQFFSDADAAEKHFGASEYCEPECQISRDRFEAMQAELDRYREEDGPKDLQMRAMEAQQARALRDAEEQGYYRGVRDMRDRVEAIRMAVEEGERLVKLEAVGKAGRLAAYDVIRKLLEMA